jgi:NAD(P)-dependent dehydrogenase (short-subunit alcohol dehydrogenase family)
MPHDEMFATRPVCLITGGSSGIGLATAMRFAQAGYRIAICGRDSARLKHALAKIEESKRSAGTDEACADNDGNRILVQRVDLSKKDQAIEFAQQVIAKLGEIDVLVNNAAAAPQAAFESITAEEFETTLDINVRTVFYMAQFVWRHWLEQSSIDPQAKKRNWKTIINISSLAAVDPFPQFSIYGASKAWMDLMTHALASEGAPHRIRVCSIRPGAVETPLLRRLFPDFPAAECATPEQVAEVVWKCVSKPDAFPSGQAFTLS